MMMLVVGVARADSELPERLTIDEAVRIARRSHPTVRAARRGEDVAQARVHEGLAPMLPSLTASASYNPQTANSSLSPAFAAALAGSSSGVSVGVTCRPGEMGCTNPQPCVVTVNMSTGLPNAGCETPSAPRSTAFNGTLFNYWTGSLALNWTLFDWGKSWYAYEATKRNREASAEASGTALLGVTSDVKTAFYNALAAQSLVRVDEEAVVTLAKHVTQMQGFVAAGTKTRVDVAQAESDVANAELALVKARGQLAGAYAALNAALGVENWRPLTLVAPPEAVAPPIAPGKEAVDVALRARPEPRQLALQSRAFEETQRSLRGAWLPALGVSLGPSLAGTSLDSLTTNFSIAVTLSSNLNPTLIYGQQLEMEATALQLAEQARAARLGVELDVAQATIAIDTARGEIVAAKTALAAAKERRDLADARFLEGVGTTLDLSDAESNYIAAQGQFIQAQLDMGLAAVKLDRAMGTL